MSLRKSSGVGGIWLDSSQRQEGWLADEELGCCVALSQGVEALPMTGQGEIEIAE